jgi:hypothetical protein
VPPEQVEGARHDAFAQHRPANQLLTWREIHMLLKQRFRNLRTRPVRQVICYDLSRRRFSVLTVPRSEKPTRDSRCTSHVWSRCQMMSCDGFRRIPAALVNSTPATSSASSPNCSLDRAIQSNSPQRRGMAALISGRRLTTHSGRSYTLSSARDTAKDIRWVFKSYAIWQASCMRQGRQPASS